MDTKSLRTTVLLAISAAVGLSLAACRAAPDPRDMSEASYAHPEVLVWMPPGFPNGWMIPQCASWM